MESLELKEENCNINKIIKKENILKNTSNKDPNHSKAKGKQEKQNKNKFEKKGFIQEQEELDDINVISSYNNTNNKMKIDSKTKNNEYDNNNDDFLILKNNNANSDLLGKKLKDSHNKNNIKANKNNIIKSINKLSIKEKVDIQDRISDDESVSEDFIEDSVSESDEIYESGKSESSDYEETNVEKITEDTKNKKSKNTEEVALWDETKDKLTKDDELVFENAAYEMLHRSSVTWPCFSVDWILPEYIIPQPIKNFYSPPISRIHLDEYPYTCHFIAGAQTAEKNGILYYMKWFNLHKTLFDEDPDNEADSESEGGEPLMEHLAIPAKGNVNKVKSMKNSNIVFYWSDLKSVELIDISNYSSLMEERWKTDDAEKDISKNQNKPTKKKKTEMKDCHLRSFRKKDEGFALDCHNFYPGVFASGGYDNDIELHIPVDEFCSDYSGGENNIYKFQTKFKAHKNGVEDLQFSLSTPHVLASVGNDKAVRIFDLRTENKSNVIGIENAHKSDINCLSWKVFKGSEMIATGSDDCSIKVWDIRMMSKNTNMVANIEYHTGPITSLTWDPFSDSQLAATSEDDRLTIWDLSVEPDNQKLKDSTTNREIPDQLVFLHQGQNNIKDVKYHPYFSNFLISSAENAINTFKPNFNYEDEEENCEEFTFNK